MSKFPSEFGGRAGDEDAPAEREEGPLSRLAKYPALGSLIEGADAEALGGMRERLARTNADLESVILHGSDEEAARATNASRACGAALTLLDDLEALQKARGRHS